MKLSADCMYCLVKRQKENIKNCADEELKANYMKDVLKIIADSDDSTTAPVVLAKINQLHQQYFNTSYSFEELKIEYNQWLLRDESKIVEKINLSDDKLLLSLKYARVGNYIDFGAMGKIEDDKLRSLLESAEDEFVDKNEYLALKNDLEHAKKLVYLTDNCGEIVLDKIFIQVIKELYPELSITVIVRGKPVLNDVTIDDAKMVGLTDIVAVMGNGTEVAGTSLSEISSEARKKIESADIIISKGQGNFETLHGCGLNIYYLFLCKCDWFVNRFQLERYTGIFISEKNVKW